MGRSSRKFVANIAGAKEVKANEKVTCMLWQTTKKIKACLLNFGVDSSFISGSCCLLKEFYYLLVILEKG